MADYCVITPGKVYGPFENLDEAKIAAGVLGMRYDLDAPAAITEMGDWRTIAIEMADWIVDFDPNAVG